MAWDCNEGGRGEEGDWGLGWQGGSASSVGVVQQVYMLSECAAFCCRFLITSSALGAAGGGLGGAHQAYAVCDAPLASESRKQKDKKKGQQQNEREREREIERYKRRGTRLDYSIPCRMKRGISTGRRSMHCMR